MEEVKSSANEDAGNGLRPNDPGLLDELRQVVPDDEEEEEE